MNLRIDTKWNGTNFSEVQSIPTTGAQHWEYFSIGGERYLALAQSFDGVSFNINSKIYKWNGTSFVEYQNNPTSGAVDWEYSSIGTDHYQAVANVYNGTTYNIDSKIYKWNGANFVETQSISTNGGIEWESFTINGTPYLALANHYNGSTFTLNSVIFEWNGTNFVPFQNITTDGAIDWKYFTIDSEHYLAVANRQTNSTFLRDSKIYKWDGTAFAEFQSLPTKGAVDWEHFTINSDEYLAVINGSDNVSRSVDSIIYKANKPPLVPIPKPDPPRTKKDDSDNNGDDDDASAPPSQPAAPAEQVFDCWPWEVNISPLAVPGAGNQCLPSLGQPPPASSSFTYLGHSTDVTVTDAAGMAISQFTPPLKICFRYTQTELAMVNGEATNFLIQTYRNGAWERLATTPEPDPSPTVLGRICAPVLFALFDERADVQSVKEPLGSLDEVKFLPETGMCSVSSWGGLLGGLFIGILMWVVLRKKYQ